MECNNYIYLEKNDIITNRCEYRFGFWKDDAWEEVNKWAPQAIGKKVGYAHLYYGAGMSFRRKKISSGKKTYVHGM